MGQPRQRLVQLGVGGIVVVIAAVVATRVVADSRSLMQTGWLAVVGAGLGAIGAALAGLWLMARADKLRAHLNRPDICDECGYDLRGSESNECPECGIPRT